MVLTLSDKRNLTASLEIMLQERVIDEMHN